jgi:hypothetical protein
LVLRFSFGHGIEAEATHQSALMCGRAAADGAGVQMTKSGCHVIADDRA